MNDAGTCKKNCCIIDTFYEWLKRGRKVSDECKNTLNKVQKYNRNATYKFPVDIYTFLKQENFTSELQEKAANIDNKKVINTELESIRTQNLPLLRDNPSREATIPLTMHSIWFTSPHNPQEVPESDISKLINNTKVFNNNQQWEFNLWTNDEQLIPHTVQSLENIPITIKTLDQFYFQNHNLECVLYKVIAKARWGMASDIFRYMLLQNGGVYMDLDQEIFDPAINEIVKTYDFFVGYEKHKFKYISNSVIGAKPDHIIITELLKAVERNMIISDDTPNYAANPLNHLCQTISSTGPGVFSAIVYKYAHKDNNLDIVFDSQVFFGDIRYINKTINLQEDYKNFTIGYQSFDTTWYP